MSSKVLWAYISIISTTRIWTKISCRHNFRPNPSKFFFLLSFKLHLSNIGTFWRLTIRTSPIILYIFFTFLLINNIHTFLIRLCCIYYADMSLTIVWCWSSIYTIYCWVKSFAHWHYIVIRSLFNDVLSLFPSVCTN